MNYRRKNWKKLWIGFIGGVLSASVIALVIGLLSFGIEAVLRKLYHPSTHLWWFVILATFLISLGGILGILWGVGRFFFTSEKKKK